MWRVRQDGEECLDHAPSPGLAQSDHAPSAGGHERRKAVAGARRCRAATGWERFRGCVTARWEVLCSPVQVSPKTADRQSGLRRARRDRGDRAPGKRRERADVFAARGSARAAETSTGRTLNEESRQRAGKRLVSSRVTADAVTAGEGPKCPLRFDRRDGGGGGFECRRGVRVGLCPVQVIQDRLVNTGTAYSRLLVSGSGHQRLMRRPGSILTWGAAQLDWTGCQPITGHRAQRLEVRAVTIKSFYN
ncbi:uncharacterized protein LOC133414183 [Phycodurus eques]|uniref:uncharacterized protein LOC133414183 n=1 Tax=Phycodurus eques TaxID=693459 RepID=UPI002ACEB0F8|nr:uncharacterized protein LOC133414183 [Phycodurus eques]